MKKQNPFPHVVVAHVPKEGAVDLLKWLAADGHELHVTVKFGKSNHSDRSPTFEQHVLFADPQKAMMFKLVWGGK